MCARVLAARSSSDKRAWMMRTIAAVSFAADDVLDAHLDEGSADNDLDGTVVLHDDCDWITGFKA